MARDNERGQSSYPFELHVRITPAYAGELLKLAEEMGHEADVAVVPLTSRLVGDDGRLYDRLAAGERLQHLDPAVVVRAGTFDTSRKLTCFCCALAIVVRSASG